MGKRSCGCKNDNISRKRSLLKKLQKSRVTDNGQTIHIGIVFHICFKNYNKVDIELDVQHTIDLLNKDFNKQGSNFDIGQDKYMDKSLQEIYNQYISLAGIGNIQFYLRDVIYKPIDSQSSENLSVLDKNIKQISPPIHPELYLNLWVVDFTGGLLGYAQFPWEDLPETDGVVIAKGTFGRNPSYSDFNLNKTATHEIGHWFGLYHTFQDTFQYEGGNIDYQNGTPEEEIQESKGDCVADTPPQGEPTYGNPFNNPNSWPESRPIDENKSHKHMFMNFMDYSDDIALFMFTQDQIIKVRQMIHIYRPNILTTEKNTQNTEPKPVDPLPEPEPIDPLQELEEPITVSCFPGLQKMGSKAKKFLKKTFRRRIG